MTETRSVDENGDGIALRPATQADYHFMRQLYASTREEELKQFPFGVYFLMPWEPK